MWQDRGKASGEKTNLHAIAAFEIENAPLGTLLTPLHADESSQPTTERTLTISDLLAESTRHDGSEWDFSDTGVQADLRPELGSHTRSIDTRRHSDSMTGARSGLERLTAPFESQKSQTQRKPQHEPEPEPDSGPDAGPDFGLG